MTVEDGEVIILGGGVAGLSAALACLEAGRRPLLLEAAPSLGGRARSFDDAAIGARLDSGPHLLIGACRQTLALLEKLGTRHLLRRVPGLPLWSREDGHFSLSYPPLPAPLHLLAALMGCTPLPWRKRLAALSFGARLALLRDVTQLEEVSVTQWLFSLGQEGAPFRYLWEPLTLAVLNEPPASAQAGLLAQVLKTAFFSGRQGADLLLPRVPLSQLLAEPAGRVIAAGGGQVYCRARVKALRAAGGRITGVLTAQGEITVKGPLICALPARAAAALLAPWWPGAVPWEALSHAPIVSLYLRFGPIPPLPGPPLLGLLGRTAQWVFDVTALRGETGTQGRLLAVVISGAYREVAMTREALITRVLGELAEVMPSLAGQEPVAVRVLKEHRATFAPWPGCTALRPQAGTPLDNLFLAGDYLDTGLPATLEGAVASGRRAAHLLPPLCLSQENLRGLRGFSKDW